MKKIFIYGVSGDIGHRVALMLSESGFSVSGIVRDPAKQRRLKSEGINADLGNIETATIEQHSEWLKDIDVVLYSAGANSDEEKKIEAVDYLGVVNSSMAAVLEKVSKYLLVSAFPEAGRARKRDAGFETYMKYKKMADTHLVSTKLYWTIIRPGRFSDAPATGKIIVSKALNYSEITKSDFAEFLSQTVRNDRYSNEIIEVTGRGA